MPSVELDGVEPRGPGARGRLGEALDEDLDLLRRERAWHGPHHGARDGGRGDGLMSRDAFRHLPSGVVDLKRDGGALGLDGPGEPRQPRPTPGARCWRPQSRKERGPPAWPTAAASVTTSPTPPRARRAR